MYRTKVKHFANNLERQPLLQNLQLLKKSIWYTYCWRSWFLNNIITTLVKRLWLHNLLSIERTLRPISIKINNFKIALDYVPVSKVDI